MADHYELSDEENPHYELSDEETPREIKMPTTYEEVANFKIPFGKYKDIPMKQVRKTQAGRRYLRWVLKWDKLYDYTRKAVELTLAEHDKTKKEISKLPLRRSKKFSPY